MNIKIAKEIRIRLDHEDIAIWNTEKNLVQKFKIGMLNFELRITFDPTASASRIHNENEGLTVCLCAEDSIKLSSNTFADSDIAIEGIKIQVDQWSKETRYNMKRS